MMRRITIAAAAASLFALALATPARAQEFIGRIDVSVEDAAGGRLAGATVTLGGAMPYTQVTDAGGRAHFLALRAGTYSVTGSQTGFTPATSSNVQVLAGASTSLVLHLAAATAAAAATGATGSPAAVEAVNAVAVTAAADRTRTTITTHVTAEDIENVPNGRDAWVLLQTVPTVYVDRVDVGGSESARQSSYNAKGAPATDNTWSIDGIPVTDMGDNPVRPQHATGASAFYYDVDTLQDMAVTTGGADAQHMTGGVQAGMVLKSGLDTPLGSVRYFLENDTLQSVNIPAALATALGNTTARGNRIDKNQDYGVEIGGPLLEHTAWIWGGISRSALNLITLNDLADSTSFTNYALKLDGKLNARVRGNFTFYENNKEETGRDAGPTRLIETSWNQTGPSRLYKGEGTFIAGDHFFASARGAYIDAGVTLAPSGGLATDYYIDDGGVAHNTYYQYQSTRPQHYAGGDASLFGGIHELKFGGSWRNAPVQTQQTWPGSHIVSIWNGYPNIIAQVTRDYQANTDALYLSGYATDTVSLGRLTIVGGARFDRQTSSLEAASVPAVAGFETVLPALTAPAMANVVAWNTLTPRLGMTLALGGSRKTIVRASYAMFASQLPAAQAAFVSPIQYSYALYNAVDTSGDSIAQRTEVQTAQGLQGFAGFNPKNPTAAVNTVGAGYKPEMTQELLAGFDHELTPQFSLSGTVTYRRMQDVSWTPLIGVTQANYARTGTLTGSAGGIGAFSVPLYAVSAAALPAGDGQVLAVRDGYHQRYLGIELSATKRLSHRWMARVGASTNSWREYFDNPATAVLDPTRAPGPSASFPFAGPQVNGGPVLTASAGTGRSNIYMIAPAYQLSASGLFEAIWGVSINASVVTRQGYAEPFFQSNVAAGDPLGPKTVLLVPNVDDFRLPAVTSLDGRIEKKFVFGSMKLAADFDVFNLLNAATVLGRQYDARLTGATGFGSTLEIMNPRVARIGVRFTF